MTYDERVAACAEIISLKQDKMWAEWGNTINTKALISIIREHFPDDSDKATIARLTKEKRFAYTERNALVALISKLYPSHLRTHPIDDENWDDEWRVIVCVHSPFGQLTWHVKIPHVVMFTHLSYDESCKWDGHTTEEKYRRIADCELAKETGETDDKVTR